MTAPGRVRRRLEREIEGLKKLRGRRSRFSNAWSYWVGDHEILHFHADGWLDLRLTRPGVRARRDVLAADPRVRLGAPSRDWIEVLVSSEGDVPFALELVRLAIAANRG